MVLSKYSRFQLHKAPSTIDSVLRSSIRSAYANVSSFRSALDAIGGSPEAIRSRDDLPRLPMSSRSDFLDRPISESTHRRVNLKRCRKSRTTGTTRAPLDVYMNQMEAVYRKLVLLNAMRRNVRFTLPFRISEVGTGILKKRSARRLDPVIVSHIPRVLLLDEQLDHLIRSRPHVITGYPSCLELVAEKLHHRPPGFAPRLVVCRGEMLSGSTRSTLTDAFACKVVDYYSCAEIGNIAWECPSNRGVLHISTDSCVVEVVDDEGMPLPVGTEGSILVTNLFNHTMPFIRYRIGDSGTLVGGDFTRCVCGYVGPSITSLAGRQQDYFVLPDGRKLSPRVIDTLVGSISNLGEGPHCVRRYQCIQATRDTIRVLMVPASHAPADLADRLTRAIERNAIGIRCSVEIVADLPSAPSGKHRQVVSKIADQR